MANAQGSTGMPDLAGLLEWRLIGPHRGGRVVAVAGDPRDPMVFYFGACAGGVWKTTDGGTYWENVSDGFFKTAAVGAIAVADADPNVVYAGTGETCIRGNVSHGDGVYRSTDGGKTWANLGLADTRHIAKIRIHPHNPDLVYVAALGHAWGPNEERGLYRSRDGGATWAKVLFRSDRAGAIDLSMDPHNPRILYATFWEAQRTPYSLSSGGPGSSLYKSTDGGDTWTELTNKRGLPAGVKGKIGVAVSPAKPDRVWALVEAEDGALFRSDDGGETWQRLSEDGELRRRAWYYMHLYADPQDPDTVWVLNLQCWKSTDGGRTFTAVPTPHGDNHDLWIDPRNPQRMIEGNDGGACVTFNGGASWSTLYNQPTAQFYHVTTDTQVPYRVYGSQQDNTALSIPSLSVRGAITQTEWYEPGGGESGYIAVRPDDPHVVFGGAIGSGEGNGRLLRYDHRTGQERNITVWPELMSMGECARDLKYRFQWTFPIVISPHDPNVLYAAANAVLRSTDEGASWEVISPDLTRNDVTKMGPSGGPITRDNTGVEVYGTIFALVESPHERGVFWAGSDDGLVHLSRDGGESWQDVTPPDLPEWALISIVEPSPHDPAAAYLAATRYKLDDVRPYLFKTADYGQTWQAITAGIPAHDFTRVIRADPDRPGLLYAGTETGVYVSFDDGASWESLQGNLPVAPIHDLAVKDRDLIAATHGRSFWILDDLTPLHHLAEQRDPGAPRLFGPRPTIRFKIYQGFGNKPGEEKNYRFAGPAVVTYRQKKRPDNSTLETLLDAGKNPPNGLIVSYYLPEEPPGDVTLTFLDGQGKEIRRFSSKTKQETATAPDGARPAAGVPAAGAEGLEAAEKPAEKEEKELRVPKEAGMHRFVWDLRYPEAHKVPGDKSTEEMLAGPAVPPGRYQVQFTVGDQTYAEWFELRKDPRVAASQEDLEAQCTLLLRIRDKLSETHDAINQIRDLKGQIDGWERRLATQATTESARDAAKALKATLSDIEDALIQTKADSPLCPPLRLNAKLAALSGFVDSADAAPTRQAYDAFDDLSAQIDVQLTRLRDVIATDLASVNRLIRESDVPPIAPAAAQQGVAGA
jgi:photosystem II stability/assembly factor-like uncharacterized protein